MDKSEAETTLLKVSINSQLDEGYQGVRLIMREILRGNNVPIRQISRLTGIPVPAVSATRRELEKRKMLIRKGGATLTDSGLELLEALGIHDREIPTFTKIHQISESMNELVVEFDELCEARPSPDYSLDQSHAVSYTCLKRAMYFHENDAIEGRDIAILGDDDLMSLAIIIFSNRFGLKINSLNVFDIDHRILTFVESVSQKLGYSVTINEINLIDDIQDSYKNRFDVIISDPPYTVAGLTRFAKVGADIVRRDMGGIAFFSYPNLSPANNTLFFSNILDFGFSPRELIPGFNEYIGAQIHAGRSNIGRFYVHGLGTPTNEIFTDQIYTNRKDF